MAIQVATPAMQLPAPAGHVNMRTPSGSGDGVKWTGWALAHGTPLFSLPQIEDAVLGERERCARLVELYARTLDRSIVGGLGDSARTLARYIREGAEALK